MSIRTWLTAPAFKLEKELEDNPGDDQWQKPRNYHERAP